MRRRRKARGRNPSAGKTGGQDKKNNQENSCALVFPEKRLSPRIWGGKKVENPKEPVYSRKELTLRGGHSGPRARGEKRDRCRLFQEWKRNIQKKKTDI